MSSKRAVVVSASWKPFFEETGVPSAIRDGDQLHVCGHTGEDGDGVYPTELEAQIRGTFRNLTETLTAAGAAWSQVVSLTSYHVGLREQQDILLRVAGEFLEAPFPAWTAVGVTELWAPEAMVEISCVASLRGDTAL